MSVLRLSPLQTSFNLADAASTLTHHQLSPQLKASIITRQVTRIQTANSVHYILLARDKQSLKLKRTDGPFEGSSGLIWLCTSTIGPAH